MEGYTKQIKTEREILGGFMLNRIEALSRVIGIDKSEIHTRISVEVENKGNEDEFFVQRKEGNVYYDVLLESEIPARVRDLLSDCFSEEELIEAYGTSVIEEIDADINIYLELVEQIEDYYIYRAI